MNIRMMQLEKNQMSKLFLYVIKKLPACVGIFMNRVSLRCILLQFEVVSSRVLGLQTVFLFPSISAPSKRK